jgi:hypothetical protein
VRETRTRDLHAASGVPYPAVWALAERSDEPRPPLSRDDRLGDAIHAYIDASSRLLERIDGRLRAMDAQTPIVVWGVGETTRKLLAISALRGLAIAAFVDSNPLYPGKILQGAPILPPASLAGTAYPILIGSLVNARGIREAIARQGLGNRVLTLADA